MQLMKWADFYAYVKGHVQAQHLTVIFVHNLDPGNIVGDIVGLTGYFIHAEWMIGLSPDGTINTANANSKIVALDKFERTLLLDGLRTKMELEARKNRTYVDNGLGDFLEDADTWEVLS